MGQLIITRRWVTERRLILSDEDWKLHDERQERKKGYDVEPLPYMVAFTRHLEPCPFCGNAPRISTLWKDRRGYYTFKLTCCEKDYLNCGDWYTQLSRAALSWNYRVRHKRGEPVKMVKHYSGGD